MELRHFRYFVAVAEELHFGRAAERVNIAQPALSIQIRQLENALGGQLFHRANRGVTLTEAGRIFLPEARQTLERATRAEEVARRAVRGELAAIEIGYSANAALSGLLAKATLAIRQCCPGLEINVHELDPQTAVAELIGRRIHFCITTTLSLDIPKELSKIVLAEWPLRVALPEDHPLALLDEIPLERLSSETFVVYARSASDDGLSVIRSIGGFSPKVGQRAASAIMVAALVGAGLGIGLLPSSLESASSPIGVVFRKLKSRNALMDCSLLAWRVEYEPAIKLAVTAVKRALVTP